MLLRPVPLAAITEALQRALHLAWLPNQLGPKGAGAPPTLVPSAVTVTGGNSKPTSTLRPMKFAARLFNNGPSGMSIDLSQKRIPASPVATNSQTLELAALASELTLLKQRDTRVVFLTAMLFSIPLAAFYPFAPTQLRDLGFLHTSAWMSLAQCSEIIAMFSLGWLLVHWRLKWIFACGLALGVLRFALSAFNTGATLLPGIFLHGASFALVFVVAQMYLEQRIDPAWRGRAQALLSLMNGGFGNLIGYLGTGWWFSTCSFSDGTHWPLFWGGLAGGVAGVLLYFLAAFRGPRPSLPAANLK